MAVMPDAILEAVHVTKHFPVHGGKSAGRFGDLRRRVVHAVDDASLGLYPGQVTALVGESGSGKSTLARILAGLYKRTSGEVLLRGQPVKATHGRAFREHVGDVQLILQDPYGSFNPMLKVSTHLQRAVRIHDSDRGVARTGASPGGAPGCAATPCTPGPANFWSRSTWCHRGSFSRNIHMSCRAVSFSGCPSPGRWPPARR